MRFQSTNAVIFDSFSFEAIRRALRTLAFCLSSVAHQDVGPLPVSARALCKSETDAGGKPLSEVSAPPVDSGNVALNMPLEGRAALTEVRHCVHGVEKAPRRKRRVGPGRGMAVAYGNVIAVERGAVSRRAVGDAVHGQVHLHAGERARRVSAVRQRYHCDGVDAALRRRLFKRMNHGIGEFLHGEVPQRWKNCFH